MAQVSIIKGIYATETASLRTSLPRNMMVVPTQNGISAGYLRPGEGISTIGIGPGTDRGAVNWNGDHYRVMGSQLVKVGADGAVTQLGTIAGEAQVTFDYSFDNLIIAGGGNLYYWNGSGLTQVTDVDLGKVVDALYVDGYTMTTDGTYIIVTDLNDPTAVNPLKYGSSEVDPDPIVGLLKLRNEVYALNRYTIEQFNNVGGDFFPFQRNEGAQLQRGAIGTYCACVYGEQLAFMGGGRNEPPAIWVGQNGSTAKLSTREVDIILSRYTEAELADCVLESRVFNAHELLYVHLPDQTLIYDLQASKEVQDQVWVTFDSSIVGNSTYRARNIVWCYDRWLCGDSTTPKLGELVDNVSTHHGDVVGWEFGTTILYNNGFGALFNMLELVALPGRVPLGAEPVVWTSYSEDGENWSQEKPCSAGKQGQRNKRLTWLRQGRMSNWRIQKFRGTSDAYLSFARLEVQLEALSA